MVKLAEHKHKTEHQAIEKLPLPLKVYIPLSQHIGKQCAPEVEIGSLVTAGQRIASAEAQVYAPIHASISGKVSAIQEWPHPVLGRCKAIVIESDGLDKLAVPSERGTPAQSRSAPGASSDKLTVSSLTPEQIRKKIFDAGIVGLGGASFPTHIKLSPPKPVQHLIVNGAECEPYLTADYRLMVEKTKEILLGIALVSRCLNVGSVFIAIEDNKPEAIASFKSAIANDKAHCQDYKVVVLKSEYPQGGEKQLIKSVLKKEVPPGKLPFEVGAVVQNVATIHAIYEAIYLGKPLYEKTITVSGDCLSRGGNFLARIGTPLQDILSFCGPFVKPPAKIIIGGPMMGMAQYSLEAPIIKNSSGVIALSQEEVKLNTEAACIRCGRCVEYCPVGLQPCFLSLASEKEKWDLAKAYGCLECMECGLCSYICPQKRNIVQAIKLAKIKLTK